MVTITQGRELHFAATTGMKKLLIIEDDPILVRIYCRFFKNDYIISTAANGKDAIALLESEDFDAVMSDQQLAGTLRGMDVKDWIKENKPELLKRHVFVTGSSVECDGLILTKPFNPMDLIRVVGELAA